MSIKCYASEREMLYTSLVKYVYAFYNRIWLKIDDLGQSYLRYLVGAKIARERGHKHTTSTIKLTFRM
jgi:hypothetical protein